MTICAYSYTVGAISCCDEYDMGRESVHLSGVSCVGSEASITQCSYTIVSSLNVSHQQDVGVQCQQGIYNIIGHFCIGNRHFCIGNRIHIVILKSYFS